MTYIFDLISTDDNAATKNGWKQVASYLATQPGFMSASLQETFHKIHPTKDYRLTSICEWEDLECWNNARQSFRNSEWSHHAKNMPAKFEAITCELHAAEGDISTPYGKDNIVLVDVIELSDEAMDGYATMWEQAKNFMADKKGFVKAHLYRSVTPESRIKFINIAEWQSTEDFAAALETEAFMRIIEDYKDNFALYLSNNVEHILQG